MTKLPLLYAKPRVDRETLRNVYFESVNNVLQFWTLDPQRETTRHNSGWRHSDFTSYLRQSEARQLIALSAKAGHADIESPNIARVPRRWVLTQRQSWLSSVDLHIFERVPPFIVYRNEIMIGELRILARLFGVQVIGKECFNYFLIGLRLKRFLSILFAALETIALGMREYLAVGLPQEERSPLSELT
jgi:hypothetical protein